MKDDRHDIISQKQITRLPLGAYDFIIIYAEQLDEETIEFRNSHSSHEIYYLLSGELTIDVDGTPVDMHDGDMLFIAPDVTHHVLHSPYKQSEYLAFLFDFKPAKRTYRLTNANILECEEIVRTLELVVGKGHFHVRGHHEAKRLIDDIHMEMGNKALGYSMIINMDYFRFFIHALRKLSMSSSVEDEKPGDLNLGIEASKYLHDNYSESISLQSVADYLHISSRHVNRVFKKMFGTTFAKTLRQLRFRHAKQYLSTTDYSVEMITGMVGLNSVQSLRKLFMQYEGITITQFKKSLVSQTDETLPCEDANDQTV
jgi:AraC-like DNA-binding protein